MPDNFTFDAETHTFSVADRVYPSVTQVIAWSGLCDYSFLDEVRSKYYLDRGKSVHWMLQLEDEGVLNYRRVPAALRGYRKAYSTWKQRSGFVPEQIEWKFVSEHNFAGIIDRCGSFPPTEMYPYGSAAVVDFKTGAAADWTRYQLAAYALGFFKNIAVAKTVRRVALSLAADGTYAVKEFEAASFVYDISRFMEELRRMNGN